MSVKSATAFGLSSGLEPGMVLLNTTSFSNTVSQRLNPFSATYDNYKIIVQISSAAGAGDVELRLASGATILTASNYNFAYMVKQLGAAAFASVGYAANGSTVWLVGGTQNSSTTGDLITIELGNPFKTAYTTYHATATRHDDYVWSVGGKVSLTTSYDGFIIQNSGSHNMTGTISVYGYNK